MSNDVIELVRAVGSEDEASREEAVAALEDLGPPPIADVARLAAMLDDRAGDVAYWAATLLGRLEADAAAAVASLAQAVTEASSIAARERAVWALGQIGLSASVALPVLRTATGSDLPRLSRLAAEAIERIAPN